MAAVPSPLPSVNQALVTCCVNGRYQLDGKNAAESITEEIFYDSHYLIVDISWESVEDSFIYFSSLTVTNRIFNTYI